MSIYKQLPKEFNLTQYLLDRNLSYPDKIAYIYNDNQYSYKEIAELVGRAASWFKQKGLEQEHLIAILLPDCIEFIIIFLSAIKMGIIPVLINQAHDISTVKYIIEDSRARLIFTTMEWKTKIVSLAPELQEKIFLVNLQNSMLLKEFSGVKSEVVPPATYKDEPAFWAYTSGSSGMPKGVVHAHYSPIVACELYAKNILKFSSQDVIYSVPPLAFTYGLGVSLYMAMYHGATVILSEDKDIFNVVNILNDKKPTMFFGIPTTYNNILLIQNICRLTTKSVRAFISAGEKLSQYVFEKWLDYTGIAICEGIGTTESTHIFISNTPGQCKPESSGQVVPGYTVKLLNEKNQESNKGQLHVIGEGWMLAYANNVLATNIALNGNVLVTNDIYSVDNEGYFYFLGRKDEMFKRDGLWISPIEIENAFRSLQFIQELAVVILKNTNNLQSTIICLVCQVDSSRISSKDEGLSLLKKQARAKLLKFKRPQKFVFLKNIPKTVTGKIDRLRIVDMLEKSEEEVAYED